MRLKSKRVWELGVKGRRAGSKLSVGAVRERRGWSEGEGAPSESANAPWEACLTLCPSPILPGAPPAAHRLWSRDRLLRCHAEQPFTSSQYKLSSSSNSCRGPRRAERDRVGMDKGLRERRECRLTECVVGGNPG